MCSTAGSPPSQPDQPPIDDYLSGLADPLRFELLSHLAMTEADPPHDIETLDTALGLTETDQLKLLHVHLPLLDNRGLIGWDRSTGTIHHGCQFADARPLILELSDTRSAPWA